VAFYLIYGVREPGYISGRLVFRFGERTRGVRTFEVASSSRAFFYTRPSVLFELWVPRGVDRCICMW
jgi:hypothetical protein